MEERKRNPRYSLLWKTSSGFSIPHILGKEKLTLEEIDCYTSMFPDEKSLIESFDGFSLDKEEEVFICYQYQKEQKTLPIIYQDPFIHSITNEKNFLNSSVEALCRYIFSCYQNKNNGFRYFLLQGKGSDYGISYRVMQHLNFAFFQSARTIEEEEANYTYFLRSLSNYLEFRRLYLAFLSYQNRLLKSEQGSLEKQKKLEKQMSFIK